MRFLLAFLAFSAFLFPLSSGSAQSSVEDERERFELWTGCSPVGLAVEDLSKPENATDIGLTREEIGTSVRSRLRAARIYKRSFVDKNLPHVFVEVNIARFSFNINFTFNKLLLDPVSENFGMASTWRISGTGSHSRDSGFILSRISLFTDEFVDAYLRVNADACGGPSN